jgi:N-acetylglucosamine repressor
MKDVSTKRERDKSVIIDIVRRLGPVSRVDIHDLTRLRPGTISLLVRELLRENKLLEVGPSDNPLGRKQVLLRLNEESGFITAIDFDADAVVAAVLNLGARIKCSIKENTYLNGGMDGLIRQLLDCTTRVVEQAGIGTGSLVGIGVADPGLIDSREGVSITSSTIEFWKGAPLKRIFEAEFDVPFLLESNTRARTIAERILGAGHMASDMVYVEYGAGIGLGIVTEGKILRGRGECAGEFGHTHVVEGGPACKCGSFGCLEAIAGAPAIATRARTAVLEGAASRVLELAGGDPSLITGFHVIDAARQGDRMCSAILDDVEKYLGLGLANVVNLFNPSLLVLDRRLGMMDESVIDQIARVVRRQALQQSTEGLEFRYSELGEEAGVLGIALMVLEQLFEIPSIKLPKFLREAGAQAANA